MTDDGSQQSNVWPLPKFSFQVTWDSQVAVFQEVSGLDLEAQVIEYRRSDNPPMAGFLISGLTDDKIILMGWFCAGLSTTGFIVLNFSHDFAGNGCKC